MPDPIHNYIKDNAESLVRRLFPLLEQPSISTQDSGMEKCAALLAQEMKDLDIETSIVPTAGYPVVLGRLDLGAPVTLILYGHYDVQPPEPLDLWNSDPFQPEIREGYIYCRGVADNKGQLFAHLMALHVLRALGRKPDCNLLFLFEGEEEVGSPNLPEFVRAQAHRLKAHGVLTADGTMTSTGNPLIMPGLKGMLGVELVCQGANQDVHSAKADIVPSPTWRLIQALASMRTPQGLVTIDGFYDDVLPLTDRERELLEGLPDDSLFQKDLLGLDSLLPVVKDEGYHIARTKPTFNISGIFSGYTGKGFKTVLASEATARLDIRLAPDQDPENILAMMRQHLDGRGYDDLKLHVKHSCPPSYTDVDHPFVQMAASAARKAFCRDPWIYPKVIGSGPDWLWTKILDLPSVIVPFAGADSSTHAPNERMSIENYLQGIRFSATLFSGLGGYLPK